MLLFIWACVVTSAFMPGGSTIATMQATTAQSHMRAQVQTEPLSAVTIDPRLLRARAGV